MIKKDTAGFKHEIKLSFNDGCLSQMNIRKRHNKHKETMSSQECTAKHFYILEQTAADYSVIILTNLNHVVVLL
jgi:hypothetical protein